MAGNNFLPTREADLVTWSTNFSRKVEETPAAFGVTVPQATAYVAAHEAFVAAYTTANDPGTRSPSNIVAKNTAMNALKENARMLARIVQAAPAVTPEQKSELGLTVRDGEGSPIPPPTVSPQIDLVSMVGRSLTIRLHNGDSTRRAKPAGVHGASVFTHVGPTPPATIAAWKFEGSITRTTTEIEFGAEHPPGTKVWVTAFWFNPRSQSGPACEPVSAVIQFGGLSMAA